MRDMLRNAIWVLVLVSCGSRTAVSPAPDQEVGRRHEARRPDPVFSRPAVVDFHMQGHFADLREIERLVVAGRLDDARSLAYLLEIPANDPGVRVWGHDVERVRDATREFRGTTTVADACRAEARIAGACAACHAKTAAVIDFGSTPEAPPTTERLARHRWAVDRVWEGLVDPSRRAAPSWQGGLEILADEAALWGGPPEIAQRLRDLASVQLKLRATSESVDKASAYGEILVLCAGCHATR